LSFSAIGRKNYSWWFGGLGDVGFSCVNWTYYYLMNHVSLTGTLGIDTKQTKEEKKRGRDLIFISLLLGFLTSTQPTH